jgi:hypothetical protein
MWETLRAKGNSVCHLAVFTGGVHSRGGWVFLPFYACGFESKNKIGSTSGCEML